MDKILPPCDDEICNALQKLLKNQGIKFMTGYKVIAGSVGSSGAKLTVESVKTGEKQELEGEIVLAATGRRPFTEQLNCKEIGINMDKMGRIDIGHEFQTNIPNIFAIGDVVKGPMLAHKAEEEGFACVENIIKEGGHVNYGAIPSVVYTAPEIAGVGKTEQELIKEKVQYKKGTFPYLANGRAKTMLETDGFVKVLTDKKTDKILGFHIIGSNAGEAIAEAGLAMEYGASAEDVARTCHAHPTMSEALKEACMAAFDKALHI
jgi:dihydrolipoamide dehydrogenase